MSVLFVGFAPAYAKDKPVKKHRVPVKTESAIASKDEQAKQTGFIFVKFKKNVSEAAIQEVADHYEAKVISPLNKAESSTHEKPEQWRKLWFESVDSLQILADRIFQDVRVDAIEHQPPVN